MITVYNGYEIKTGKDSLGNAKHSVQPVGEEVSEFNTMLEALHFIDGLEDVK